MSQSSTTMDYHAPDITELSRNRDPQGFDPLAGNESGITRALAKRLIPACLVTPALLWWVLAFGVHRHWYQIETALVLFVYSVTVVFGVIVCFNLRRLSRLDKQRAETQRQLQRAKEVAETANRFKSVFFANISHEIRTPLTAINGFAELLLNPERTNEERLNDARVIRRNGEHLLTLINDILDLSKIEAGKMSVERILCSPAQIVGEVCSMLRHRVAEKGLTLDVSFDGPIPKLIRTDPTRLRQVLINLVNNAVKFTKDGGVKVLVSIKPSLKAVTPRLEVKITDSGIGIAPEQLAQLFQPFVQGDSTIARQYGGSGLGLAISRHFARALEGDIAVTSKAGGGSTFTVTVGTGELGNAEVLENPQEAMNTQEQVRDQKVRIEGRVLVAEDGADNQALIAAKLAEIGLKAEIAVNGKIACEKALAALESGKPFDLILMDVQMPVMDGFSATLALRGKGYRGAIIALTANAMDRDRSKCLSAGCNDFVTKPIQMEKLIRAMGRYLKVISIAPKSSIAGGESASNRGLLVQRFYEELGAEVGQIEEAIEREDRVRLKEVVQLVLGKAAAAGLKEIAPQAAKLMQSAESERSWNVLREAARDFAKDAQAEPSRRAA